MFRTETSRAWLSVYLLTVAVACLIAIILMPSVPAEASPRQQNASGTGETSSSAGVDRTPDRYAAGSPEVVGKASISAGASALDVAQAIAPDNDLISGADFVIQPPAGSPAAVSDTPLAGFPRNGTGYGILSTGDAGIADNPNDSESTSGNNGGDNVRGDTDFDVTILKVDLSIPQDADCLSFDFKFLSEEFDEYIGSQFNDAFIAELDNSNWSTSGSAVGAPKNFAATPDGAPITVNDVGFGASSIAAAGGTTYDGATNTLRASTSVTPGAHSLFLSIFDQGDQDYDSAVFFDQLAAYSAGAAGCATGLDVADAADKYAPLVKLHSEEQHWPVSAEEFIASSQLRWSNNNCRDVTVAGAGKVSANGLGAGTYRRKAIKRCVPRKYKPRTFKSNDYTRPFGKGRNSQLKPQDGFFLDIGDNARAGLAPLDGDVVAPVYYETTQAYGATTPGVHDDDGFSHTVITYWFSYGYSVPKTVAGKPIGSHEGDWEHINVHLSVDGKRATQVDYFAHHDPANRVLYAEVEKFDGHPVVYSVKGAHGSYPNVGETEVCNVVLGFNGCTMDRRDDAGARWRTWLWTEDVRETGWYGYGGAWGRIGTSFVDTTGPLGPSKYKNPLSPG